MSSRSYAETKRVDNDWRYKDNYKIINATIWKNQGIEKKSYQIWLSRYVVNSKYNFNSFFTEKNISINK